MAYQKLQVSEGLVVIPSATVRIPDPSTVVVLDPITVLNPTATGATEGSASFTTLNTLTATGTKFTELGIAIGSIVYTDSPKAYYVVSIDSDTQLTLSGGAVGSGTDKYTIYNKATIGCILFNGVAGDLTVQMAAKNGNTTTAAQSANHELTYKNIANGSFLPTQVVRVAATTTATDIIALW
jgi:hypothetical protein